MRPVVSSKRPTDERTRRPLALLLLVLGVLAGWIGADLWRHHAVTAAIGALAPAERRAAFVRAREELASTCTEQPERLADHCRAQADFILQFPECDVACQQLARRFLPAARR